MTIICALRTPSSVWVGSDTEVQDKPPDTLRYRGGPKWDFHDGWAVASAGEYRLTNLVQANLADLFFSLGPDDAGAAWLFAERLRELVQEDDWRPEDGGGPPDYDQSVILTDGRVLWSIGGTFDVLPVADFLAEGCGRDFAYGAYHALATRYQSIFINFRPEEMIELAVEAAMRYSPGCGGGVFCRKVSRGATIQEGFP